MLETGRGPQPDNQPTPEGLESKKAAQFAQLTEIQNKITALESKSEAIFKELANGDPVMIDVLKHHAKHVEAVNEWANRVGLEDNVITFGPKNIEGVDVYPVGGNSSAKIFLAKKPDGTYIRYVESLNYSGEVNENAVHTYPHVYDDGTVAEEIWEGSFQEVDVEVASGETHVNWGYTGKIAG